LGVVPFALLDEAAVLALASASGACGLALGETPRLGDPAAGVTRAARAAPAAAASAATVWAAAAPAAAWEPEKISTVMWVNSTRGDTGWPGPSGGGT